MKRRWLRVWLLLMLLPLPTLAAAGSLPGGPALYFYGGTMAGGSGSRQLSAPHNPWLLGLGYVGQSETLAPWQPDVALLLFWRDYDTTLPPPAWSSIDSDMSLQTLALTLGLRRELTVSPQFVVYGLGGVGLYQSKMVASGSTFGLPGTIEERSNTANLYAGVGIEWRTARYRWALDYRSMPFTGSFEKFGVHDAGIGGDLLFIGFGSAW